MFKDTFLLPLAAALSLELQDLGSCHRSQCPNNDDQNQARKTINENRV
jgi:hypothetical protein